MWQSCVEIDEYSAWPKVNSANQDLIGVSQTQCESVSATCVYYEQLHPIKCIDLGYVTLLSIHSRYATSLTTPFTLSFLVVPLFDCLLTFDSAMGCTTTAWGAEGVGVQGWLKGGGRVDVSIVTYSP